MKVHLFVAFLAVAMIVAMAAPTTEDETDIDENNRHATIAPAKSEDEEEAPTTSSPPTRANPNPTPSPAEKRCNALIGKYVNGTFVGLEVKHDLEKLLIKYGGPAGKVNATWTKKKDAPVKKEDLQRRPLPEADEKFWLYKYGNTDYKSYVRVEYAVQRFSGTPKAFLEVRGTLYFAPEDFCGKLRKAHYVHDDRGFTFEVSREYCWITSKSVTCANPASCTTDEERNNSCVPYSALMATLIGPGK